jgi:serine palmitoyltransferase
VPIRCFLSQGADGTGRGAAKLAQLKSNSNFVRNQLRAMGCEVLGDEDSPVRAMRCRHRCGISSHTHAHLTPCVCSRPALAPVHIQVMPIMLYNPGKIPAFSREARTCADTQHAVCDARMASLRLR